MLAAMSRYLTVTASGQYSTHHPSIANLQRVKRVVIVPGATWRLYMK